MTRVCVARAGALGPEEVETRSQGRGTWPFQGGAWVRVLRDPPRPPLRCPVIQVVTGSTPGSGPKNPKFCEAPGTLCKNLRKSCAKLCRIVTMYIANPQDCVRHTSKHDISWWAL